MPTFEMTAGKMRALNNGATFMLNEDLDLMFSMRLATIQEAIEPILKPVEKTLTAHDKKFRKLGEDGNPIPMKRNGVVIGNMVDPAKADEAAVEEGKILDKVKKVICPDIPWKDLERAQVEDGIRVPGWVLKAFKPLLNAKGVDLTKAGLGKPAAKKEKPKGRAATLKAAREAEEAEGQEE